MEQNRQSPKNQTSPNMTENGASMIFTTKTMTGAAFLDLVDVNNGEYFVGVFDDHIAVTDDDGQVKDIPFKWNTELVLLNNLESF